MVIQKSARVRFKEKHLLDLFWRHLFHIIKILTCVYLIEKEVNNSERKIDEKRCGENSS